jgi:L-seryl-tRNA(Ser) seleniumtransferase
MDIYERLGVKKLINAWGTVTRVGGSLVDPSVMEAMTEASHAYIDFEEYHTKAGQYIAKLIGVEAAFISSGAAAGIAIATAACIVGTDSVGINQLPDTTGFKDEVILLKSHRSRLTKVPHGRCKLVEVACRLTLLNNWNVILRSRHVYHLQSRIHTGAFL